ncbi:MAG: DUF58 domain-containing protein [Planctomycetota bacterium]
MANVHETSKEKGRVESFFTTDFCPWATRFVYWLKEPIGWFVLATAICCMIGLYFSPVGWTLAAALVALMTVGMLWPLIAVFSTTVTLRSESVAVHEDAGCGLVVGVRNWLPIPVWGLKVEGYLDQVSDDDTLPTVALASVPSRSLADYRIEVCPSLRGKYPVEIPNVACSFPFALWTARRPLKEVAPLTVWPKVYDMAGESQFRGSIATEFGEGQRGGRDGDFIGVREYRRGDSAKHVNWVASARTGELIVTERGAPETASIEVWVDTAVREAGREELNRRMRIAASLIASLYRENAVVKVRVGERLVSGRGEAGLRKVFDELAAVPLAGSDIAKCRMGSGSWIGISGSEAGTTVRQTNLRHSLRAVNAVHERVFSADEDLATAMRTFWREKGHVDEAA